MLVHWDDRHVSSFYVNIWICSCWGTVYLLRLMEKHCGDRPKPKAKAKRTKKTRGQGDAKAQ